ncbi:thiol-disulfide oxidoreductase DCC family protein [Ideonella sp. BN130291]|uniref:thiol-disulfide oxidoreductase DCC family protein n=1 Tax=Ideonella sp. BN130291 TaxID=3112940 RepID=UPI002E25753B|nr:DUF393 domain-containing protein [Ideonella sp. BN130291]
MIARSVYPLTLYYESACALCNAEMTNLMLRNHAGLLHFVDVSAPGFDEPPPGVTVDELLELIHAVQADGTVIRGVPVFEHAYRAVGLGWVMAPVRLPGMRALADRLYPWLARNRHRVPRALVHGLFETSVRRAAERAAGRRCDAGGSCRL